ncbi:hypothetical protein ACHWQZ_G002576 [Mnemiopsis leidyi]
MLLLYRCANSDRPAFNSVTQSTVPQRMRQDGVLIGLVETVGKLGESNEELRALVSELQKKQLETEAQLKAQKAALSLAQMEIKKLRTVPPAAVLYSVHPHALNRNVA